MSKIAQAVQGFLNSMEWPWREIDPTRYEVIVPGHTARWTWLVRWEEDESFFACYSILPVNVPVKLRPVIAEYLTRANYNLRLGNFELDYSDGQVCFKTSMNMNEIEPTTEIVRRMAFSNFTNMDQYLPGMMSVIYGKVSPNDAIAEAERPKKDAETKDDGDDSIQDHGSGSGAADGAVATSRKLVARTRNRLISRRARMAQFRRYLQLMDKRAHGETKNDCFLIFARPDELSAPTTDPCSPPRMVRFQFNTDWFAMIIPNTNLRPEEAERIVEQRGGFHREAEHPQAITEDVNYLVQFDPVGKKYIYGDEREAAEDAAYLFFDVWKLAPDAELQVTASAFGGPSWETDARLE